MQDENKAANDAQWLYERVEQYRTIPTIPDEILSEKEDVVAEEKLTMLSEANRPNLAYDNMEAFLNKLPPQTRLYRGSDFAHLSGMREDWTFDLRIALNFARQDHTFGQHELPFLEETTTRELLEYEGKVAARIKKTGGKPHYEGINRLVGIGNSFWSIKELSRIELGETRTTDLVFPKRQYRLDLPQR